MLSVLPTDAPPSNSLPSSPGPARFGRWWRLLGLLPAVAGALAAGPIALAAETPSLVVTTLADTVNSNDNQTSLREALAYAAALGGARTITFSNSTANGAVNFYDGTARTLALAGTQLQVNSADVTIQGPGSALLKISGGLVSRVFYVPAGKKLTANQLTIADGRTTSQAFQLGGAVYVEGSYYGSHADIVGSISGEGGGICVAPTGRAEIVDSSIRSNSAQYGGGAQNSGALLLTRTSISENDVQTRIGGGLYATGSSTTTVKSSVVRDNTAGAGAGIYMEMHSTVHVDNSTIGNNRATQAGGGILNDANGSSGSYLTLTNATVSGNTAGPVSGGSFGGGVYTGNNASVANSIIAGNSVANGSFADIGPSFASRGSNLIGATDGATITGTTTGNLLNVDPRLGPLAENGGPTKTFALLSGSPAIDAGSNALAIGSDGQPFDSDQRGNARTSWGLVGSLDSRVDIGAYEAPIYVITITFANPNLSTRFRDASFDLAASTQPSYPGGTFRVQGESQDITVFNCSGRPLGVYNVTYTVQDPHFPRTFSATCTVSISEPISTNVTTANDVNDPYDGQTSLREALAYATALGISGPPQTVTFSSTTANGAVNFYDGTPRTITFTGNPPAGVGQGASVVGPGASLLTVKSTVGSIGGSDQAIFRVFGPKPTSITGLTISGGSDSGIANSGNGVLTVANCRLTGNNVGLYNAGVVTAANCAFDGNMTAGLMGNGTATNAKRCALTGNGVGVVSMAGTTMIVSCTVSGNTSHGATNDASINLFDSTISGNGGRGVTSSSNSVLLATNCTVTANVGGVVWPGGTVTLRNNLISGNTAPSGAAEVSLGGTISTQNNLLGHAGLTNAQAFAGFTPSGTDRTATSNGTHPTALGAILSPALANNGGPTLTHSLPPGSPAIDAGDNALLPADTLDLNANNNVTEALPYDQRGLPRVTKGSLASPGVWVDAGAYETPAVPMILQNPQDQVVTLGGTATFTALASGIFNFAGPNSLTNGATLQPEQFLVSSNRSYRLLYQGDGNLVLYRGDGSVLWATNTAGQMAGFIAMQADGNFVVYDAGGVARFATNTSGNPGAVLLLQDDGNLVIYRNGGGPVFATDTAYVGPDDPTTSLQWQVSADGGTNYANIAGANVPTLTFTPGVADSGKRYRAVLTNSRATLATASALLTVLTPIQSWRLLQGLPVDGSLDLANPSGDGVPNLLKYAFNLAPNPGDLAMPNGRVLVHGGMSGLPLITRDVQGRLVIEFVRRRAATIPGIEYTVETGADLNSLQTLSLDGAVIVSIDGVWERVTVTDPTVTSERFGRVRVAKP